MAYSPDPDRRPVPAYVWLSLAILAAVTLLTGAAPVIIRAIVGALAGA